MTTEPVPYNPAYDYRDTIALYIEGVKCRFSSLRMTSEEGSAPYLSISVPATPELRHVGPRARVHLITVEPSPPYNAVVLGEFEIAERGFSKDSDQRSLTFNAVHVTAHLEQYEITTLDTAAAIRALGSAGQQAGTQVSLAFTGNILELLKPEQLVAHLREFRAGKDPDSALAAAASAGSANRAFDDRKLTVQDVVFGTFLIYRKIFKNSRLADLYTSVAIDMHQLAARFQYPDSALVNWSNVYANLMTQLLLKGPQQAGGSQTYLDVVRGLCQFFLYSVSIVPNAESVTKQIQIKPLTHFNAIPHCNVFFPSMAGALSMQEDFASTPTRVQTLLLPPGMTGNEDLSLFQRKLTAFAPVELQYLWDKIVDATEHGTAAKPVKQKPKQVYTFTKPADGIPFVTLEEERRGIVPLQYTLPPLLTTVIVGMTSRVEQRGSDPDADLPDLPSPEFGTEREYELNRQLLSTAAPDRLAKYRAYLCLALGDGAGISTEYPTARKFRALLNRVSTASSLPHFVPDRITILPVAPGYIGTCGANYAIRADGKITQLRGREYHLFQEPECVPYGANIGANAPSNAQVPPVGLSYQGWRAQGAATFKGTLSGPMNLVSVRAQYTLTVSPDSTRPDFKQLLGAAGVEVKLSTEDTDYYAVLEGIQGDKAVIWFRGQGEGEVPGPGEYTVTITQTPSRPQLKPWVFCPKKGTAWAASHVQAVLTSLAADENQAVNLSIIPDTGNERNLVIALELKPGTTNLYLPQQASLVSLIAVVQELQLTSVGSAKQPSYKGTSIPIKFMHELFGLAPSDFGYTPVKLNLVGLDSLRAAFRAEFEKWDKNLSADDAKEKYVPIVATGDAAQNLPLETPDPPPTTASSRADSTQETSAKTEKQTTVLNVPAFDTVTKGFLRGFLNYQFYAARIAPRSMTVSLPYHPYATVGYPALVLDSTGGGYDLIGYVHAVVHDFTASSASTTVVLTHVRRTITENGTDLAALEAAINKTPYAPSAEASSQAVNSTVLQREAMIPFSKTLTQQYIFLPPINSGTVMAKLGLGAPITDPATQQPMTNLDVIRNPKAYAEYLRRLAGTATAPCVIPNTFLPIQLHDLDTKLPPVFVYDGGFGLGKFDAEAAANGRKGPTSSLRNFKTYATFVGYNQADNNTAAQLNAESRFVFADTIKNLNRNLTVREAYAFNRRGIQRLGQNNLAAATASLVDYSDKDAVGADAELAAAATVVDKVQDATVSKLPTGSKAIPAQIVVYKQPPIYVKGKRTQNGKLLTFDNKIRELVARHNAHIAQSEALLNLDS